MKMQEIREQAKEFGIKTSRMSKVKLIQSIQLSEGNYGCFSTAVDGYCDQTLCKWRDDCFIMAKKAHKLS